MKYLLKKTLAILLSIAMVLSMTTMVMAEETNQADSGSSTQGEITINNTDGESETTQQETSLSQDSVTTNVITSFEAVDAIEIEIGAEDAPILPGKITATVGGTLAEIDVIWTIADGETFSSDTVKSFSYTASITNIEYSLGDGVNLPTITVRVVAPILRTMLLSEQQLIPEVDSNSQSIFANGVAITIEAGGATGTSKIKYGDNLYLDLNADLSGVQQEANLSGYHIYGGSKDASVSDTSITMNGGTVIDIYGAGYEGGSSAENTSVTVNGGTVSTVYGGGAWSGASAENTSVTISGGTVECVYGGGSAGAVRGDTTVTVSGGIVSIVYGGGSDGAVKGKASVTISENAEILDSDAGGISGNVYGGGGSYSATVGSSLVTMDGGTVTKIYGGGFNGAISGNTSVTVNDGTVTDVYGGGRFCAVSGDTSVTVNNGTVTDVYGGGSSGSSSSSATVDNTSVTIRGGTVTKVYGGGESDSDTVKGDTSVTISGGTMAAIYGGSKSGAVSGDTSITVNGGAVEYIYGGGYESSSTVVGSTSVNISGGGTFRGVYGGGYNGAVNDNTSVTVSGGTVIDVFGGGVNGAVNGDTSVNITGTAEFTTTSSGGGGKIYGGGASGAVNGSTFVTVNGGTFVNVNGDTIDNNVFGGGYESTSTVTGSKNGYVTLADKVNADSFTNLLHKTNNGWALKGSPIIPENQTMTIGNSETFTINEGETLTNKGTLVVAGTLTGVGTLAGDGTFKKSLMEGDNITIENVVYTGAEITPIINTTTIMGMAFVYDTTEYTPTYQKKNGDNWEIIDKVKESGDYKITFTKDSTTVSAEFKVVGIKFAGADTALAVKQTPIYGDKWNDILSLDASKLSAMLNDQAVTGTYTLLLDDTAFDGTAIPNQGNYLYKVTFTTTDNKFKDIEVLSGMITVDKKEVSITWGNGNFTYNGENQKPTATITNKVGNDEVSITVTGEQKNAGTGYTATANLSGSKADNYNLPILNTTTFSITPTTATGNVTVLISDYNGNGKLDFGDAVTAEIAAVTPQGGTASYQWKKIADGSTSDIGTNQNSYAIKGIDAKGTIFCEITFSGNTTGTITSNKLDIAKEILTGSITISGDNTLGSALNVSLQTNTNITSSDYDIVWYHDNVAITGANSATHTLVKEDLGTVIKVVITAKETSKDYTGSLISNEISIPATTPDKAVVSSSVGNAYVNLSWNKPFANGSEITGYSLVVKQGETNITGSPFAIEKDVTNYKVESLTNDTTYTFILSTTNGTGTTVSETVTATPKAPSTGGGSSGGSGSSGGGTITTPSATPEITIKLSTTVTNGTATATVSDKSVADAITKAQAEAKKNGIFIELNVDTGNKAVDSVTAILLKNSLDQLVKAGVKEVSIKNAAADIRLNLETLKEIQKTAGSDVNISAKKVDNNTLSAEAKKVVGNRPIFDFSITGKNGEKVSDFGKGSVSVSIPYTLGANENPENVVAYYIDANGKVKEMPNSVYDAKTKTLSFVTDHFSQFAVGYKNTTVTFSDIENHWAKESIEFVSERGLFSGTGNGKFSPNLSMTRGMFVTALGRLAEVDTKAYTKSSFTDVKTDAYYMSYVEWANKNGIVKGVSTTTFAPDQKITREQMAVILANYAKSISLDLPQVHKENIFADNNKNSDWAKKAVKEMQMSGVISGKDNNVFDPQGTATRAEASAMLKRLVEIQ